MMIGQGKSRDEDEGKYRKLRARMGQDTNKNSMKSTDSTRCIDTTADGEQGKDRNNSSTKDENKPKKQNDLKGEYRSELLVTSKTVSER